MNEARSTRRFRLFVIMAPMIALALGSFWLLEVMRRSASEDIPNVTRTEPDFYVEKFNYVKMSKDGGVQYHMAGERMTHNPVDDSYDIVKPVVNNLRQGEEPPITLRADRARVVSDVSEVHLYDNVRMDRPASPTGERMHAESEYLLVLPDDDVIKTHKPVDITVGQSRLTGVGMIANNATREFQLSSNVHGTYQAPAR
ncbi:LPS export ABC transporter periplasmic protein LptC [Noviherbaspirillum sp.]|uniref:LPS export ABC transporter periplasmic protein LptC n=1 Tax=Noviherbaspirillum sp. TaxID=1926288 RepID=UPI002FE2969D